MYVIECDTIFRYTMNVELLQQERNAHRWNIINFFTTKFILDSVRSKKNLKGLVPNLSYYCFKRNTTQR